MNPPPGAPTLPERDERMGGALALRGSVNIASRGRSCGITLRILALRESRMDRDVLDVIEREIDQEARARFPGTPVRQAVLLQYGDDPEIGPGDLWVGVLLDADGPEDYEPTLTAFLLAGDTAGDQFAG